ncbi:MAG: arginine--tRNA ligase [Candidatus Hydrogenedentes bacterium]|nr:arginine--tRNA ligase [Candidatus Hydrogenedentota bacterium]
MNPFETLSAPILAAFSELEPDDLVFAPPPKLDMGDVALRTFECARKLKMPPPAIAARIANEVAFGPDVAEVSTAGPYVNFKLDRAAFGRAIVAEALGRGAGFGSNGSGAGKRALVEHTSINPNASPHVGRARNAMLGDSIVRLLRFEGYDVEVHYYVNDIGRQIALLVLACDDPASMSFDDMLDVYRAANARAEAEPEFAEQGYALLARIEEGDAETRERFHAITDLCLKGQVAVLARLGIAYDSFDRESDHVRDPRLEPVVEALRERGAVFTDEEGRLSVDLSKLGHEHDEGRYIALLRSNGSSMYAYRDVAYTIDKMERGADLNLIVLGEDHKLHMQQIALILDAAGKAAPEPVYYAYILLKEGKMSTRQGKVVLLSEFLDEATARAAEKVDEQCTDLAAEERAAIAEKVAVAAIRFAILRVGANKNVVFDWESSLSFTGDTGPYVQYSCARIASILRKLAAQTGAPAPTEVAGEFPVETDAEWALLTKIASLHETVAAAVRQRSCAPVAQFALDTARLFTTFYHECPVIDAGSDAQRNARAQICMATRQAIENALGLLGIDALERM